MSDCCVAYYGCSNQDLKCISFVRMSFKQDVNRTSKDIKGYEDQNQGYCSSVVRLVTTFVTSHEAAPKYMTSMCVYNVYDTSININIHNI